MSTENSGGLWYDLHTHCLPGMDDGAKDVETSVRMLQAIGKQGVSHVALTPHFYPHKEELPSLLARRDRAFQSLSRSRHFRARSAAVVLRAQQRPAFGAAAAIL